jgi:dTDP-4-dehydrorhamnose reductase
MNNILVTGANGRLGTELVENHDCIKYTENLLDRLWHDLLRIRVDTPFDVIINCAAMTDVDACEKDFESACFSNVIGVLTLIKAANDLNVHVVQLSTDYVFGGGKQKGVFDEWAYYYPINFYGSTKMEAEISMANLCKKFSIIRTTVLYGSRKKPDFVTSIIDKLKKGVPFEVTKSVIGTPTYIPHLAEAIMEYINSGCEGRIINIAGTTCLSRYEFALMIANVWGYDPKLIVPTLKTFGDAKRTKVGGLDTSLAVVRGLPVYSAIEGLQEMRKWYQ